MGIREVGVVVWCGGVVIRKIFGRSGGGWEDLWFGCGWVWGGVGEMGPGYLRYGSGWVFDTST